MADPFARIAYPDEPRPEPKPVSRFVHLTEIQVHGPNDTPFRYACSCGDRGMWNATTERAREVAAKHVRSKGGW